MSNLSSFATNIVNMINDLPDVVLGDMLSFLPTKEAVRTSILCKRWRNLYRLVASFDFSFSCSFCDDCIDLDRKKRNFENFVDSIINHRSQQSIKRFSLRLSHYTPDHASLSLPYSNLNSWICLPLVNHVEELDIHISGYEFQFEFPQILFSCETLRILKLTTSFTSYNIDVFNIPEVVFLPRLKVLHLRTHDTLRDGELEKILSGCPAIEDLSIDMDSAAYLITICVKSSSLKSLRMIVPEQDVVYGSKSLFIDAPNLELLELISSSHFEVLEVVFFSNLIEATLNIRDLPFADSQVQEANFSHLLKQVSNSRTLTLDGHMLWHTKRSSGLIPCFDNLRQLNVLAIKGSFWDGLVQLLENIPNLESIKLIKEYESYSVNDDESFLEKPGPQCLLSSLKTIVINVSDRRRDERVKMMIKYFLKHAMILEKLKLTSPVLNSEEGLILLEEISVFPKASTTCEFDYENI